MFENRWTNPFEQPLVVNTGGGGFGGSMPPQQGDAIWGHPKTESPEVKAETPTNQQAQAQQVWTNANPQVNPYQRQVQVQINEGPSGPPGPVFQAAGSQPQGTFQQSMAPLGFDGRPEPQGAPQAMFQRVDFHKPETQSMAPNLGFDGRPEASFEPQNGHAGPVPGQFAQPSFPQAGQHGQANPQVPMSQPIYGNPGNHFAPTSQMQHQGQQGNLYGQIQPFGQQLPDPQLQFGSDARNCTCGQPAVLLNVKKEGPNQGRGFFKCAKQHPDQPCSFFEWADEPPRGAQMAPGAPPMPGMPQLPPGPLCPCGQPSLTLTVKKDGPNQGRNFYKCAQNQCGYFQWADQEPDPQGPPCGCGVPSVRRIVQKEGPNRGRPFMICVKRGCDFFQWADEEPKTGAPTPTPARAGTVSRSREGDVCFHCNQPGHWAGSCPNKAAGAPKGRGKGRGRGRGRKKATDNRSQWFQAGYGEDDFGGFTDDRFNPY